MTIRVLSFEYDGCLAAENTIYSNENNIIKNNLSLISSLRADNLSFEKTITFIGSNRQSKNIDNQLALEYKNGSCFVMTPLISNYLAADFDPFLLEDAYYDKESGSSFKGFTTSINPHLHVNKTAIIYTQMHKISYEYPAKSIMFHFFDGDERKMKVVSDFFALNAYLIPKNVSLTFVVYQTPKVLRYLLPIQGQGTTDTNYRATAKTMSMDIMPKNTPDVLEAAILPEAIISTPNQPIVGGDNLAAKFGYYEIMGHRDEQEDALAWQILPSQHINNLLPIQIGYRLWTSYKILDGYENKLANAGCTASTTIYDGKNNFITATLGDAASFVAMYDKTNTLLAVIRLNSITHKPENPLEKKRIQQANGTVENKHGTWRVNGKTNISRGIGDHYIIGRYNEKLICSDATIDINNIATLAEYSGINQDDVDTIKLIVTCDGFTDAAYYTQTKQAHEEFLFSCLKHCSKHITEKDMAMALTQQALKKSWDNISVAIQTISLSLLPSDAIFLGVYDGHGGNAASHFVANTILPTFIEQCMLNNNIYMAQSDSVMTLQNLYTRDNNNYWLEAPLAHSSSSSSEHQDFFSPTFFKPASDFTITQSSLLSEALQQKKATIPILSEDTAFSAK